jgi:hypothetical protein
MAMVADEGKVTQLHLFEERVSGEGKKRKSTKKPEAEAEQETEAKTRDIIEKWFERDGVIKTCYRNATAAF